MRRKALVVFLFLVLVAFLSLTITYFLAVCSGPEESPVKKFDVSVYEIDTDQTDIVAFIEIETLSPNMDLEEIKKRADEEAQKIGGESEITNVISNSYQKWSGWQFFGRGNSESTTLIFHTAKFVVRK